MRTQLSKCVSNIAWTTGKLTCFNRDDWQIGEVASVAVDGKDLVIGLRLVHDGPRVEFNDRVRRFTGAYRVRMPLDSVWVVVDRHLRSGGQGFFEVISFYTRQRCEDGGVTPRWQLVLVV